MIRLNEIKMPLGTKELEVKKEVSKILHIKESDIKDFSLARRSIDSRKKDNILLQTFKIGFIGQCCMVWSGIVSIVWETKLFRIFFFFPP